MQDQMSKKAKGSSKTNGQTCPKVQSSIILKLVLFECILKYSPKVYFKCQLPNGSKWVTSRQRNISAWNKN